MAVGVFLYSCIMKAEQVRNEEATKAKRRFPGAQVQW